jgi:hypothetical protein
LVLVVAVAIGSVPFYFAFATAENDVKTLDSRTTYAIMFGICLAFILNFAYFIYQMEPKYRRTFFSTERGYQWAQNYFLKGTSDGVRVQVTDFNHHQWKSIRPEVIEFFHENWAKWEEEKPKFFTAAFKKRLDDDLLPPDVLREMNEKYGGGRRRSSLGEILGLVGEEKDNSRVVPVANDVDEGNEEDAV